MTPSIRPTRSPTAGATRLPDVAHSLLPWRIHDLARGFRLEDVWALPTPGGPDDFSRLVHLVMGGGLVPTSWSAKTLFAIRRRIGALLGWDDADEGPGVGTQSLRGLLPNEMRDTASDLKVAEGSPFRALYLLKDELAAEIANRTVHGILHLGWVADGSGGHRGQMAILVRPNGRLGAVYMASIAPLRHHVVYPAMLEQIGRAWRRDTSAATGTTAGPPRLPPGQRFADGFPRFGTHLSRPAPTVPSNPEIRVHGAGVTPFAVPLAALSSLPRTERTADLHCVAGWSAADLRWEGVALDTFHRRFIVPALPADTDVTHLVFAGSDGHRSLMTIEDARADGVMIAERLDGQRLDTDHGAPARLVSPDHYAFVSTKHLARIELHTSEPTDVYDRPELRLLSPHRRARVWEEERNALLPAWAVRSVYRMLIPPIRYLSSVGSGRRRPPTG